MIEPFPICGRALLMPHSVLLFLRLCCVSGIACNAVEYSACFRRVRPGRISASWPACSSRSPTTGTSSVVRTCRSWSCRPTCSFCSWSGCCRWSTTTRTCSDFCSACCWRSAWCRSWRSACLTASSSWSESSSVCRWASPSYCCCCSSSTWRRYATATPASTSTASRSRRPTATRRKCPSSASVTSLTWLVSDPRHGRWWRSGPGLGAVRSDCSVEQGRHEVRGPSHILQSDIWLWNILHASLSVAVLDRETILLMVHNVARWLVEVLSLYEKHWLRLVVVFQGSIQDSLVCAWNTHSARKLNKQTLVSDVVERNLRRNVITIRLWSHRNIRCGDSKFIYLFIVCQKSSMWQSHVSKHEAGQWD